MLLWFTMLNFLVTADHAYTLTSFFSSWGASQASQVRIVYYESLASQGSPLPGVWIFTDIERLNPQELSQAAAFYQFLTTDPKRWLPINDPAKVLCRYALLSQLVKAGINSFRAFKLNVLSDDLVYPVFIRGESDHMGSLTGLIPDREALENEIAKLQPDVLSKGLLVVEFCQYARSNDGLYVKYSLMRVNNEFTPRHVLFSREWQVKQPDYLSQKTVAEEVTYITATAQEHMEELLQVFNLANIYYGRIDYTVVNGNIRVFEINTNPMLVPIISQIEPSRWVSQAISATGLLTSLQRVGNGLTIPTQEELKAARELDKKQNAALNTQNTLKRL